MQSLRTKGLALVLGGLIGCGIAPVLRAQTSTADPNQAAAAERAQREADKVYKWILIHADKPNKRPADTKPPAAAPQAVAPAAAPVRAAAARPNRSEGVAERAAPQETASVASRNARGSGTTSPPAELASNAAAPASSAVPASAASDSTLALAPATADTPSPAALTPPPEPEEDLPLQLVKQVDPEFPTPVIRKLEKGSVQVRFEVLPDGSVRQPEVVKTSHVKLNAAALEAVSQWRFMPLKHSQYGVVELAFDLR